MNDFDFFGDDDARDSHDDFFAGRPGDRDRPGDRGRRADRRSRGDRGRRGDRERRGDRDRRAGRAGGGKRRRRRRRSGGGALLLALIVIIAFVGGAGYVGYTRLRDYMRPPDYPGTGHGHVLVHVRSGDTATAVAGTLVKKDVVKSTRAFVLAAKHNTRGADIAPGYYKLHRHMKATAALTMLLDPDSKEYSKVTIVEGKREREILATFAKGTGISLKRYRAAARHPRRLRLPGYAHGHLEGYLFPATYNVQPDDKARTVLRAAVHQFKLAADDVHLTRHAAHRVHLTPSQVVVVASLLQAEGGRVSDYPKIARVLYNRLAHHDHLQLDTTVLYAEHKRTLHVYNKDLQVKSPYNTYTHRGLPPGPICSPGEAALRAALHPARGNWYYFITTDPKRKITKFTASAKQFAKYKKELERNLRNQ